MWKFITILLVVFFVVPYLLRSFVRYLFGETPQPNKTSQQRSKSSASSSSNKQSSTKKKFFSKNEGEYIDYEEVKDASK